MSESRTAQRTALTLGAALAAVPAAQAATFTVTNLDDAGAGSLRQALDDANGAPGADAVEFQDGLSGTIVLTSGQLEIVDSVSVQGPGSGTIAVSGNNSSRVFYLYNAAALLDVTISGLTVTGGSAGDGAGIIDWGENLVLDDVSLSDNAASGDGGGLWADGSGFALQVRNSVISGNDAADGGGIYVDGAGALLIQNTVITGNTAADDGGGIYLYSPEGDTAIEESTISGNTAGDLGGGIYLYDTDGGTHTIRRTTISGNEAIGGGGIFLYGPDDPFLIENSTISGNRATGGNGGGIYLYNSYGTTFDVHHSTIAGNTAAGTGGGVHLNTGSGMEIESSIAGNNGDMNGNDLSGGGTFDVRFSLVESPGTATINDLGGNVFNQDPQLGPLQSNGGPNETHHPASTSPAKDAGDPAFVPPPFTDQRGLPRVADGRLDMGAVETGPPQSAAEIPTAGDAAKLLLVGGLGAAGMLALRRKQRESS